MRTSEKAMIDEVMQIFEIQDISDDIKNQIEDYISFEQPKLELKLKTLNLRENRFENHRKLIGDINSKLWKKKDTELGARLFDALFQVFGTSVIESVRNIGLYKTLIDPAQKAAYYVAFISRDGDYLRPDCISEIIEVTNNRQDFIKAIDLIDKSAVNEELALYAAIITQQKPSKERSEKNIPKEQSEIYERYTELLIEVAPYVFLPELTQDEEKLVREYLSPEKKKLNLNIFSSDKKKKELSKELKNLAETHMLDRRNSKFVIGCAAAAYGMSEVVSKLFLLLSKTTPYNITDQSQQSMIRPNSNMLAFVIRNGGYFRRQDETGFFTGLSNTAYTEDMQKEAIVWFKEFEPDVKQYIMWNARQNYRRALEFFATDYSDEYIKTISEAALEEKAELLKVINNLPKNIYDKYYSGMASDQQGNMKKGVIETIVPNVPDNPEVKLIAGQFFAGDITADELFLKMPDLKKYIDIYGKDLRALEQYKNAYGFDDFFFRCLCFEVMKEKYGMIIPFIGRYSDFSKENYYKILDGMKSAGLGASKLVNTIANIIDWEYVKDKFIESGREYLKKLLKDSDTDEAQTELLAAFKNSSATGRCLGIYVLKENPERFKTALMEYFGDSSKQVHEELDPVLAAQTDWFDEYMNILLTSKKGAERETAAKLFKKYEGTKNYQDDLKKALDKEKSAKVEAVIREVLSLSGEAGEKGAAEQKNLSLDDYVKNLVKGNQKKTVNWAFEQPVPEVHRLDGEVASEDYLRGVLLSYSTLSNPETTAGQNRLTENLDKKELASFILLIYERWLGLGAETKKKWVLYAASVLGGQEIVNRLKPQITEWAQNSRGAIAAEAVKALVLNDSPITLLIVDEMARKFKFKQVKNAAKDALKNVSVKLGLTVEELGDKIVPNLGFDIRGERSFDYGPRSFKVKLTQDLDLLITDESGKKYKNLPAVGKNDDPTKAADSIAEFKDMKKNLKNTVKNQTSRLENILLTNRKWTVKGWKELFVNNPIMHSFAMSLIWGSYENGKLIQSFRYMDDGSFNTVDEDEYELPENDSVKIGLIHPTEISSEEIDSWKEQLSDYELQQPFDQLDRPVFRVTDEEKKMKHIERFGGKEMNGLSLSGKLVGFGWSKGIPMDGGVFTEYYRADPEVGYSIELRFSGSYIGDENDDITVFSASVYKDDDMNQRGFRYDMKQDEKAVLLGEIDERYFSEIILQLTKATASSTSTDESWRDEE